MKTAWFAVVLSSLIASLPVEAEENRVQQVMPSTVQQATSKINLNTATADILTKSFKGIGPKRAAAIVVYREKHGNFKSVEGLAEVRGIGLPFVNNHLTQLQEVFVVE